MNIATSVPAQDLNHDTLLLDLPKAKVGDVIAPVLGKIPLLARLGKGAMGAVYYGIHPRLKIEVAVKVLQSFLAEQDPALIERFYREAQTAARVSSRHLVHVSDVDEESGLFYIVMEYVKGCSVAEYLREKKGTGAKGLDEGEALRIVIAASKGLAAAHGEGIIHRDVKPGNIMLPQRKTGGGYELDYAKLADLGLARPENKDKELTVSFEALGTPGYMAPEQAEDASSAGKPADIFSMGATLYAVLAGHAPFTGKSSMEILSNTIREPHVSICELRPDVSLKTAALIDRCLAKEAARRCADADALVKALRSCREELGGTQVIAVKSADDTTMFSKRSRARKTSVTRRQTRAVKAPKPPAPAPVPEGGTTRLTRDEEPMDAKKTQPSAKAVTDIPPEQAAPMGGFPGDSSALMAAKLYTRWPFDAFEARVRQRDTAAAVGLPQLNSVPLDAGVHLDMTLLPAGEFAIGSPHSEEFREKDEFQHYVRHTRPFYIGIFPVTQEQWQAVAGGNPSKFKDEEDSPRRPVERVSWNDIRDKFLPKLQPLASPGWQFRLPTEAEWEYAARAGAETPFCFGDAISIQKLNCKEDRTSGHDWKWIYSHDLMGHPTERQETTPAGSYPANAWGLHDVHGNVWEWCEDVYSEGFYQNVRSVDPVNTAPGEGRVLRGGSWNYTARYARAACRYHSPAESRNFAYGFRIVCAPIATGTPEEA